jgi:hypothetical protein
MNSARSNAFRLQDRWLYGAVASYVLFQVVLLFAARGESFAYVLEARIFVLPATAILSLISYPLASDRKLSLLACCLAVFSILGVLLGALVFAAYALAAV